MKSLDIPKKGKCGNEVHGKNHYGAHVRGHGVPTNRRTARQRRQRGDFGGFSNAWGTVLTEAQRLAWIAAGAKVERHDCFGKPYTLTGQGHFEGINSARACIGREMLVEPPQPVVFGPNPVGELLISKAGGRVALKLRVGGPVREDIMVFGQAPCSAGRMKCRNVVYLGLLPDPEGGWSDITEMYAAVHGEPPEGAKVFIRTRQQRDGWEGLDSDTSAIVQGEQGPAARRRGG